MKYLRGGAAAGLMLCLALTLLVNGCGVDQVREVQTYRSVLDGGKPAHVASYQPEAPLSLKRAFELANAHNEQLAMSGETYLQALIDKDRAFAAFLPTISFVPTFMFQAKTELAPGNPLISEFEPTHAIDLPVEGGLNVSPFHDVATLQAARFSARMQRYLLLDKQAILMLEVASTYYQIMRSESQIDVLRYTIEVERRRLFDIRVKEKAGTARPVDVSLIEAQLAQTRSRMVAAKEDERNGRAMLALLIGAPKISGPLSGGLTIPAADYTVEPLLKAAGEHRQDLIAAREQVKASTAVLKAAWARYFPSISLNFMYYLSRQSFPNDVNWTSLIQVNVPIFTAGLVHEDVRAAYSRLRQARLSETYTGRRVKKELLVALENFRGDEQQIEELTIQVKAAREGVLQAESAYEAGVGTNLERLIAQDRLLQAELNLVTAQFNHNVNYLRLLRVTGSLNPDLSIELPLEKNTFHETKK
jgi:outer membrane protein TolC